MISPEGLLDHARRLAGRGRGRPFETDLRRGVSAAYYAVFHDLTDRAARHLIGSSSDAERNALRRAWSHGELAHAAALVIDRAKALAANPNAPLTKEMLNAGPLITIAASDEDLVTALRIFCELQEKRHQADYDHDVRYDKLRLLEACSSAESARSKLASASNASREALFTLLTVRRPDFRER